MKLEGWEPAADGKLTKSPKSASRAGEVDATAAAVVGGCCGRLSKLANRLEEGSLNDHEDDTGLYDETGMKNSLDRLRL